MNTNNPYQSSEVETVVAEVVEPRSMFELARPIFLAWEKLRLLHIAVAGAVVVGTFAVAPVTIDLVTLETAALLVGCGVFSNVCFFAGPLCESYLTWIGLDLPWLRPTLFWTGTIFTCLMAMFVVVGLIA